MFPIARAPSAGPPSITPIPSLAILDINELHQKKSGEKANRQASLVLVIVEYHSKLFCETKIPAAVIHNNNGLGIQRRNRSIIILYQTYSNKQVFVI